MSRRRELKGLVERREGLVVPGAYDGVSARLVARARFPAVYMTGYGTSASRLGLPDLGFAGLTEMVENVRQIAASVSIPLIADADTGYGNPIQVRRTIQAYEAAGVAALHLEDQVWPKRCGHLAGKQVIGAQEMAEKIRAAVDARQDPNLLIIARTDALAVNGFDDAMQRATLYAKAGADVLFVEAPTMLAQIEAIPKALDRPCLFNYAPGGRSPLVPLSQLRALGYAIIILPVQTLFAAARAVAAYLEAVRAADDPASLDDRLMPFTEFNDLLGVTELLAMAERYEPRP